MIKDTSFSEWSLREEILQITHRWPDIIIFCLLGSLIGLVISFCLPSPNRATKEMYVGLNIYQATEDRNASEFAGINFTNPNDYKNWQMANLNSLIYMDSIINETLIRLKSIDPYWSNLDQKVFAGMLHAYWRNAGKWRLVAENANPRYASQAVLTWEDVVVNHVHNAIYESQKVMILDKQLDSLTQTQAELISKSAEFSQIRESLISWRTNANVRDLDNPANDSDRINIRQLVEQIVAEGSGQGLLDAYPTPEAPLQDYIVWLDNVLPSLDEQLRIVQTQIAVLEDKKNEISQIYADSSRKSLGLSANLQVDKITTTQPELTVVRPIGMLVLIGGILGLILWSIVWLTRISLRARK